MTEPTVDSYSDPTRLRRFMKHLLNDVRALEKMIEDGMIEEGIRRIGAEQELCLVDRNGWGPAPVADKVLKSLDERVFTPEVGRFNVEFNVEPLRFGGNCLSQLEKVLNQRIEEARGAANDGGWEVVMTGILPTIQKSDLGLENMMPKQRYYALNSAIRRLRGEEFEVRITGTDDLSLRHESVMLEACNTSCQAHFQVGPEEFAELYNLAQVCTAPVLAAAVNSPLLFGRRLWKETRIALFQQAVDTRQPGHHLRERSARVSFGNDWVHESVLEIYREDITRFRVMLGIDVEEDPFKVLEEGGVPKLQALQLHNGTIYRWNRPCYGVLDGKPNLRIEFRALPAGPTVVDQIANAAFWFGLLSALSRTYQDITKVIEFDKAKRNFIDAARNGLGAQLTWLEGKIVPAGVLITQELLPIAREGLQRAGIESQDIDRYLGVIEERVASERTGAQWLLESLAAMDGNAKLVEKMSALTAATLNRQVDGKPVHTWDLARLEEGGGWEASYQRVEQYMSTDLFTVHEDEVIDLVANMMDWKHVRHIPVEDEEHRLVGIVSYRMLLRLLARDLPQGKDWPVPVREVMHRNPITASPSTTTLEAIELMRKNKVACLPVVQDGRLVGIVTEHDFLRVAGDLLTKKLREQEAMGS
jgi:CBS domain-containing protein/gamma-glutamyl:cysteine ligase YbdK (ATP-grasp superfamily)